VIVATSSHNGSRLPHKRSAIVDAVPEREEEEKMQGVEGAGCPWVQPLGEGDAVMLATMQARMKTIRGWRTTAAAVRWIPFCWALHSFTAFAYV